MMTHKVGLILTGGGARAAYQVGVLSAIQRILVKAGYADQQNPFPIICGTSAGAINATALACRADHFGESVRTLKKVWSSFEPGYIYRSDSWGMSSVAGRWMSSVVFGWLFRLFHLQPSLSLLDNMPLAETLHTFLDLPRLDKVLANGALDALAVTASSYTSGRHLTFYQSNKVIPPYKRVKRDVVADQISTEHLLASSAIPFIFPATPMFYEGRREYFGDGAMQQTAPLSPAIHLGADKILVVGVSRADDGDEHPVPVNVKSPSVAQIAGHALSNIFADGLAADLERVQRINNTLSLLNETQKKQTALRVVETLVIEPSAQIDVIASQHIRSLPRPIRLMLSAMGGTDPEGSALASYLLFEKGFTQELIALGEKDAMAVSEAIIHFFEMKSV